VEKKSKSIFQISISISEFIIWQFSVKTFHILYMRRLSTFEIWTFTKKFS
jgi:hypothetical protein